MYVYVCVSFVYKANAQEANCIPRYAIVVYVMHWGSRKVGVRNGLSAYIVGRW